MFDEAAARATLHRGLVADRRSTQGWDVEAWSASWRDSTGVLTPGSLGKDGGAWWFRAITDSGRLTAQIGEIATDPLSTVGARARIAAFVGEANQVLVHWPLSALAPIAFPLREALGLNEAFAVLAEALPPSALADFVPWLGPVDSNVARRWMNEIAEPHVIAALGLAACDFEVALSRLTSLGALGEAAALAEHAPVDVRAAWVLEARQPVTIDLLEASLDVVDDETFAALAHRVLRRRDRRLWDALTLRPLPILAEKLLDQLGDPVAPWVFRFFDAGGDPMIDSLLVLAQRRGRRGAAAIRALHHIDRTAIQLRLDLLDSDVARKLLDKLQPDLGALPELPADIWPDWMTAVSRLEPEPADWVDVDAMPPLATRDGHRLSRGVQDGILALLQRVRFDVAGSGSGDDYDPALGELLGLLNPDSANAWWNALFAMWWTNHRPEVRWVMYAAAFMCDGVAIRDLGAKLRRHQTWFGNLSSRVIVALGHNPSPWSVAALDDITHRSTNTTHRELAAKFLQRRADAAGVTLDRFVASNYPNEPDPVLIDAAARRIEITMGEQRVWNEFLLRQHLEIAPFRFVFEAIVWCIVDEWGDVVSFFSIDSGELIGVAGDGVVVEPEWAITVAHPAQLADDELMAWHQYCADHEIVQPFSQLERPRFRSDSLSRDGFQSPVGTPISGREFLRRAEPMGWTPVRRGAHGDIVGIERRFPAMDVCAELRFTESLEDDGSGESTAGGLAFSSLSGDELNAADVHAVAFSEAHYELTQLMPKTP